MQIIQNLVLFLIASQSVLASYYLPGVQPNHYEQGDKVTILPEYFSSFLSSVVFFFQIVLKANKVTSTKTPLHYEYYDLPFCKRGRSKSRAENLGERLAGDTVTNSPYELRMKQDEACVSLCRKVHKKGDIEMFKTMIDNEYRVHWLLDNLPVAVRNDELGYVSRGYPVGFLATTPKQKKPQHYLFNHVRIIIRYNELPDDASGVATIVGFEVIPFSIKVRKNPFLCSKLFFFTIIFCFISLLIARIRRFW
jgi:transmembrane 9 superfamily protein 2/4